MSQAYKARKKEQKRKLDEENPERRRIRNLIRKGIYSRFMLVMDRRRTQKWVTDLTGKDGVFKLAPKGRKSAVIGLQSVFHTLTREDS